MTETEKLIEIYNQLEDAGLMVVSGKKESAELMVSRDVVPVVRCKDCKHCYKSSGSSTGYRCRVWGVCDTDCEVYLNYFCSYGERRTHE